MDSAAVMGRLFGIGLVVLIWVFAWINAKKRKIGLTITSFLALFLTPLIGCLVPLFTKKIDATQKYPTYKQRLRYENTIALLIAAILYIVIGMLLLIIGLVAMSTATMYDRSFIPPIISSLILITWGILLFSERKKLMEAKASSSPGENEWAKSNESNISGDSFRPYFVFDSKIQQRITKDLDQSQTSHSARKIEVGYNGKDRYKVDIFDDESGRTIMQNVYMHEESYSDIDECLSLKSDDSSEEYSLNVFYKNGHVDKCVVYRKSKDVYIHYFN